MMKTNDSHTCSRELYFESYFQVELPAKWWSRRVATVDAADGVQRLCKQLLRLVTDYIASWRPPDLTDYLALESCAASLDRLIKEVEDAGVAPVARILAYDYMGLAYDKVARRPGSTEVERVRALAQSANAFEKCLELAATYDDKDLQLWMGYALFNLARVNHRRGDPRWRDMLRRAVSVRSSWQRAGHVIPEDIEEGLITEYFHAAATLAETDVTLTPEEIGLLHSQYEDWRSRARERVRLARNVAETWQRILAKTHR